MWPGYALHRQALIAYDSTRMTILTGVSRPPTGFQPVPSVGFGVFAKLGPLPELLHSRSPEIKFWGTTAVALPYAFILRDDAALPWKVFAPAFSAWADRHFKTKAEYDRLAKGRYPAESAENAAASELENRLLALALKARVAGEARRYCAMFAAVRRDRRRRIPRTVGRYEDLAEIGEGIPRYVAAAYSAWAHDDPAFSSLTRVPSGWQSWEQAEKGLIRALEYPLDRETLRRDRYALTGMAEARLMAKLGDASWRTRAQNGIPPFDLLAATVGPSGERQGFLSQGRLAGGWDDLLLAQSDPSRRFPESYRSWLRSPGRKLTCWLAPLEGGGVRLSSHAPPLEIDAHTVFANALDSFAYRVKHLELKLDGTAMAWHGPSLDWPYQRVSFFLTDEARVEIGGQALSAGDGTYNINNGLSVKAENLSLMVTQGKIIVKGRDLEVRP